MIYTYLYYILYMICISRLAFGACLVFFVNLLVEGMSCTLEGGLRPPFVFNACGFVLCSVLVSCLSVGARLVFFESLTFGRMSCIVGMIKYMASLLLWSCGVMYTNIYIYTYMICV